MPNEAYLQALLDKSSKGSSDFDLNPELRLDGVSLRPAAVLIGVRPGLDGSLTGARVILTRRSAQLRHHPGQVAFPGGKLDQGDPSPEAAALREAHEEIGLEPSSVTLIGRLPDHQTVTGYLVTPVLGLVSGPYHPRCEPGEVAEIFEVPLSHLLDIRNYRIESRHWRGQLRHYYTIPWGPWYIWGATARILRGLAGPV